MEGKILIDRNPVTKLPEIKIKLARLSQRHEDPRDGLLQEFVQLVDKDSAANLVITYPEDNEDNQTCFITIVQ